MGDPFKKPQTRMTWEEFIERCPFADTLQEYCGWDDPEDLPRLDELVGEREIYNVSEYWENPSRSAFHFLENLDLGPELNGDNGIGEINFYDGLSPADDSQFVDVPDYLSISLLQKRLNEIDGTVAVEVLGLEDLNGRTPYFN